MNNSNSLFLTPITEEEILNVVLNMSNKTSTDCYNINMETVKKCIDVIVKPLTNIFNKSFNTGVFPDSMKTAKVVPIFKSGNKSEFTNYRPISLLPQFSKILEKLFDIRFESFLKKNNVLNESQYGFRSGRSTLMALTEMLEEITTAKDKKMSTVAVFIDLKKAFDTLNHEILVNKLYHYGIRGIVLEWIVSYLSKRKQFVQINDISSEHKTIRCGVPQGSVLGPKLFNIYINDLCNVSSMLRCVLFADDTTIICSKYDLKELCTEVNNELNKVSDWFNINKLSLNLNKTNFMLFASSKSSVYVPITIKNTHLERVYLTKILGIYIDQNLTWKHHVSYVLNKLSKCVGILHRVQHLLGREPLYKLYCSLFLPYITYCSMVWGNTYHSNILPIFIKQKKAMRIVCKVKSDHHSAELFANMNSLNFFQIVELQSATFMYKAFHQLLPCNLQKYFTIKSNVYGIETKQKNMLYQSYVRTTKKQHCISVAGVKLWNSINNDLRNSYSVLMFKKIYKNYMLNIM